MSEKDLARRSRIKVKFAGVDITSNLMPYLLSLNYTDNEEDETDDLQIKLQDRDGIWLEKWLNNAVESAAEGGTTLNHIPENSSSSTQYVIVNIYKVIATNVNVHGRPGEQYYVYGTLPYGSIITSKGVAEGWVNFDYERKNSYVKAEYLTVIGTKQIEDNSSTQKATTTAKTISVSEKKKGTSKGMKISAVILRENWNSDGKDEMLDCGQFELDSVGASGPPATVTIKATSLPYSSTVRQVQKSKSWENTTLSAIAKKIATDNGMACMFESTADTAYTRVEQYRKSDITFLQQLCHNSGRSLKVTNNIIVIFDQEEYEKKRTVLTLTHGDGKYVKYKLSTGDNDMYTSCRVSYTTSNGAVISATAYVEDYNDTKDDNDKTKNQCLEVRQKVGSKEEAQTLAHKLLRLHNKFEYTANFTLPGNPRLVAGCSVMLKEWGAWSGRYIIKTAKHNISNAGYTTTIDLRKVIDQNVSEEISSKSQADIDNVARAVIRGEWDNGTERKRKLTEAGYDYETVQKRVNEMLGY